MTNKYQIEKYLVNKRFVFLILTLLVIINYAATLKNGLVSDDLGLLKVKDQLTSTNYIFADKLSFIWNLIHAPIYFLFGVNPFFLRLLNIFFHLGNVFLIYLIVSLIESPLAGFFTAGIFAVHPIALESVAWISGGSYSEYTFFFLVSLFFYIKKNISNKFYLFSITAYILGLFTSNRVMTLFPIYILYEVAFGNFKRDWKKTIPFILLGFIWMLIYIPQINLRLDDLNSYNNSTGAFKNPSLIAFGLASYIWLIFWPKNLAFHHVTSFIDLKIVVAITFSFLLAFIYSFFKSKKIFFWLGFFLTGLAINLTPLKISWVVSERYAYLSAIGLIALLSLLLLKINRRLALLIFLTVVVLLSVRTYYRSLDWKDNLSLIKANIKTDPNDISSFVALGESYNLDGKPDQAIAIFKKAFELDPNNYLVNYDLGYLYQKENKLPEAIFFLSRAKNIRPTKPLPLQGLAEIYFQLKDYGQAINYYSKAIQIDPTNLRTLKGLGDSYQSSGDSQKAQEIFAKLNQLNQKTTP